MPNDKDGIDDKMSKYIANWDGIGVLAHFLKKPWNSELFGTSLQCPIYFSKVIFMVLHLQFDQRLLFRRQFAKFRRKIEFSDTSNIVYTMDSKLQLKQCTTSNHNVIIVSQPLEFTKIQASSVDIHSGQVKFSRVKFQSVNFSIPTLLEIFIMQSRNPLVSHNLGVSIPRKLKRSFSW